MYLQLYCNDTLARIARSYFVAYSTFVSNMEKISHRAQVQK